MVAARAKQMCDFSLSSLHTFAWRKGEPRVENPLYCYGSTRKLVLNMRVKFGSDTCIGSSASALNVPDWSKNWNAAYNLVRASIPIYSYARSDQLEAAFLFFDQSGAFNALALEPMLVSLPNFTRMLRTSLRVDPYSINDFQRAVRPCARQTCAG